MKIALIVCIIIQGICTVANIWSLLNLRKNNKEIEDAIRINKRNLRE